MGIFLKFERCARRSALDLPNLVFTHRCAVDRRAVVRMAAGVRLSGRRSEGRPAEQTGRNVGCATGSHPFDTVEFVNGGGATGLLVPGPKTWTRDGRSGGISATAPRFSGRGGSPHRRAVGLRGDTSQATGSPLCHRISPPCWLPAGANDHPVGIKSRSRSHRSSCTC